MGQKLLIGLTGLAGAGKSTASRYITNAYNIPRKPFAYHLKAMVGALGIPAAELDGPASVKALPSEKLGGHTIRYAMQTLGTEWGRKCMGENFWVDLWSIGLDELPGAVADDCRFDNEVAAITDRGGVIIRIERDGAGLPGVAGMHASEAGVGGVHFVLKNNGSIDALEWGIRSIIRKWSGVEPLQHSFWPKAGSFDA